MASPSVPFELAFTVFFWLLCWCFLTPLLFYHLYRFYSLKETAIIHKRHYRIVIVINIIISLYLTVSRPCLVLAVMEGSAGPNHNCLKAIPECSILQTIADLSDSITNHGWTTLLLVRMWLIFFATTYNEAASKDDQKWTQFIHKTGSCNESQNTQQTTWTHRVAHTFGNECWILTRVWIPYYIFAILCSVFSLVIHTTFKYDVLLYIPLLTAFAILWYKTSKASDVLKVRHEMRLILRCATFGVLVFALYSVLLSHSQFEAYRVYIIYAFETFFAVWISIYGLCTTKWVMSYSGLYAPAIAQLLVFMDPKKSARSKKKTESEDEKIPSLTDVLSKTATLQVFMKHLCDEWSMESLLCVIECYQFKQFIRNKRGSSSQDAATYEHKTYLDHLRLETESLPQSSIVYDTELSLADKMRKLVDKYIRIESEFQVNIGHYCRENVVNGCDKETEKPMTDVDFFQCFDEVLSELMNLMQDSYFRFMNAGGTTLCEMHESKDHEVDSRSPSPSPSSMSFPLDM